MSTGAIAKIRTNPGRSVNDVSHPVYAVQLDIGVREHFADDGAHPFVSVGHRELEPPQFYFFQGPKESAPEAQRFRRSSVEAQYEGLPS